MNRSFWLGLTASTVLAGIGSASLAQQTAELIIADPEIYSGEAYAVSPTGAIVVGRRNGEAFIWDSLIHQWDAGDPFRTPQGLGGAGSVAYAVATSTLAPGIHYIVGDAFNPDGEKRGFVTTYNANAHIAFPMQDIGTLNGGNYVSARGISETGGIIVGFARDGDTGKMRAFRVARDNLDGGLESLGAMGGFDGSWAYGISGNGEVIVGEAYNETSGIYREAFRWTEAAGMETLGKLNNSDSSTARAASFYGDVITGWAVDGSDQLAKAFRWTEETGMVSLGTLPGHDASWAHGISHNGAVIVGASGIFGEVGTRAFRWSEDDQMQTVEQWLTESGATLFGPNLTSIAYGTNIDGSVVVGVMADGQMFIARGDGDARMAGGPGDGDPTGGDTGDGGGDVGGGIGDGGDTGATGTDPDDADGGDGTTTGDTDTTDMPDVPQAGLITVADLAESLAGAGATTTGALTGMTVMLNGAGSRPLDRLAEPGRSIIWTTGDLGLTDEHRHNGWFGLGEIGAGHNFGALQTNVTVGYARQEHDSPLGGETSTDSVYGRGEILARLHGSDQSGLWAIVTGAFAYGSADLQRNYVANGGAIVSSYGESDVNAVGVRGRVQWHNALPFVSPYGELAWSRACIDGYTETGGPFPATFNRKCDEETLARYGIDVTIPVTDRLRLTGTLEGAHRVDGSTAATTGQVIGLQTFSVPGLDRPDAWVRGGIGFEADLNERATLGVMANGTTGSGTSSGWISANMRMRF